VTDDIRR